MDAPKTPGFAGKPRWGGGTAPSSPSCGTQKRLWLCAANALSSGPWALLALLLQGSFGVVLDDPFAAQFPPWVPFPFLNTLFSCFSLSPGRLLTRLRGTLAGFSSDPGLDPLFPSWGLGSSGFLWDQRSSFRTPRSCP